MAGGAIDSILNVIIPIAVFVVFGFVFYKGFKDPIDRLIAWIRDYIAGVREKNAMSASGGYDYGLKRSPYAIDGGDINYRY